MPKSRTPMNKKDGARVTLRLTVAQEGRLHALDRKTRRQLVPRLRNHIDNILTKLKTTK